MIGRHTRLRKNDDLPLKRVPAVNENMRSKDAQCKTNE